jgi:hypothetical protein
MPAISGGGRTGTNIRPSGLVPRIAKRIRDGDRYIIKPLADLEAQLREDLPVAEKTGQAFAEYRKGTSTRKSEEDFFDKIASVS